MKQIIQKIQSWDKYLFWEIYEKYVDEIYKFIFLKISDKQISEDLTSETFFSALQNISQFDAENENSNFRAWIYKIAYNKVINFYRIKDREVEIPDDFDIIFENNFSENLDNKNKLEEVLKYIKTLNKNERNVIIYRIWYDLSFSEIAEILWLSLDNCKKISSRTMKKIYSNFVTILFIFLIF